ncbi:MAG: hypothetical protein Q8R24_05825 [Legionellaceae bacterium]|nr:hypothetical protein [Legionellaceae bacterium]
MPTSSGTTVGTSQAPLPTLPRSPRIAKKKAFLKRLFFLFFRLFTNYTYEYEHVCNLCEKHDEQHVQYHMPHHEQRAQHPLKPSQYHMQHHEQHPLQCYQHRQQHL